MTCSMTYAAFRPSSDLVVDPEFMKIIPPLSHDEYDGLVESLKKEGCRDAIVISGRTIIDGHNRYGICNKYNIPFKTIQMEFANRNEIEMWMIKNQFARRNLTPYQRAKLALRIKPVIMQMAKQNQAGAISLSNTRKPIDSRAESAKLAKVCTATVGQLERILKYANDDVKTALEKEEITIGTAYKKLFNIKYTQYNLTIPIKLISSLRSVNKHPEYQKKLEKALTQLVADLKGTERKITI